MLLIEQPEVNIHPKLQAEVGDLLIHSAKERGNQLLVETHSEHLLLRLLRRVRERFCTRTT
ncbi:MAG: AAA family ATPase [Candidatus Nanopelagicales bacterium]